MTSSSPASPRPDPSVHGADLPRPQLSVVGPPPSALDDLGARIVSGSGRLAAATCRWLLLVAEFDAADGCRRFGLRSTARWLAHACGLADRTAVDHVRVARALTDHPRLVDEMSAGRLSYSHVRSISRVARAGEHALVEELVNVAEHGTVRQLESVVRGLRTVRDTDTGRSPAESLTFGWTANSQWRLSARFDPERGAVVEAAVRKLAAADGIPQSEALVRLAEIGLAALADDAPSPRALRGDERAAVVIHLDATQVRPEPAGSGADGSEIGSREPIRPSATPGSPRPGRPFARLADGPGLPASVVERLLCSGCIRTAVRDGTRPGADVLALGRARRSVNARQFRALLIRHDGHCAHPGCRSRARLEAHHVVHWLHGGPTNLANLVLLCEAHHHAHHDREFEITAVARGRFRFTRPDGRELLPHPDPALLTADGDGGTGTDAALDVDATAATTRWDGTRLDHHYAVDVLARHLRPARLPRPA